MGLNSNSLKTEHSCRPFFSQGSCTIPPAPQAARSGLLQTLPSRRPIGTWSSSIYSHSSAANTKLLMLSTIFKLLMHCSSYNFCILQYLSLLRAWDFWFACLELKNCSARGSKIATEKKIILFYNTFLGLSKLLFSQGRHFTLYSLTESQKSNLFQDTAP